ncbi:hypothetical protein LLH00_13390 [bacterium]|nr:hypothetical protein [bacterium]
MLRMAALSVLLLVVVLLVGCKESSSNLLTTSSSELASVPETFTWKYLDNNGVMVQKEVLPVPWDGKSKLEDGVLYSFSSLDQMKEAYAGDAVSLKEIEEMESLAASGQKKKESSIQLAALPPNSWVTIDLYHNPYVVSATVETNNGAYTDGATITHRLRMWENGSLAFSATVPYSDGLAHHNVMDHTFPCPTSVEASGSVTSSTGGQTGNSDTESCP